MGPIMVVGVGLPDCLPFLAKFHYIEFWGTNYTSDGSLYKQFFLPTSAMECKTFSSFLISCMVPMMVGVLVYQIVSLFWQNSITLDFG